MLTAGEVAGLIVALFWAILVCFLAMVLVKLARLIDRTSRSVADLSERVVPLLEDVSLTVAETNRQLVAVEAIAGNMREASGNVAKVTGVASTLFATPLIKASALVHGVRGAFSARRRAAALPRGRRQP
ncbi:hypothetical protein GCM10009677_40840 [Sphaerisporangium rubeum]|uniref:Uncharacterized protein YoxC n=1 Tax=Sphaerisporangium rubeum TaxID=321317 RepID=A0A7X0M6N4_9ACTN|nr:DUF948 domain-containing protein [Sphaerisporangium rubeum]MBB6473432.1 uncharacterized protein YoxC [Sphaerisporangium rubeum]